MFHIRSIKLVRSIPGSLGPRYDNLSSYNLNCSQVLWSANLRWYTPSDDLDWTGRIGGLRWIKTLGRNAVRVRMEIYCLCPILVVKEPLFTTKRGFAAIQIVDSTSKSEMEMSTKTSQLVVGLLTLPVRDSIFQ